MATSIAARLAERGSVQRGEDSQWQLEESVQDRPAQPANADVIVAEPTEVQPREPNFEKIERETALARKEAQKVLKQSDDQVMRDAVKGIRFIVDQHDDIYVVIPKPFTQIASVDSQRGKDYLTKIVFDQTGRAPSIQLLERELGVLKANQRLFGKRDQTHNRIAQEGSSHYLDLGDGRRVVFPGDGTWDVRENHTVFFIRGSSYGTLPEPVRVISAATAFTGMQSWLQSWGLRDDKAALLLVAMINMLRPGVTQLIIQIHGPAGSAKSTLQTQLAGFIDPTVSGNRPMTKLTESDIAAVASNVRILCADNLSKLSVDEQDLMCKIATGTVLAFRRLYTQNEVFQTEVRAPFIITSLVPVIKAADALSRTLTVSLPPKQNHRSSEDVQAEYEAMKPKLLGHVCELFAAAVKRLPEVKLQRQWEGRLVDYQQLGEAVFQAGGHGPGAFLSIFEADRKQMATESAEGDLFTKALRAVLDDFQSKAIPAEKLPPTSNWGRTKESLGYACVKLPDGHVNIGIRLGTLLEFLYTKVRSPEFLTGDMWVPRGERQLADALVRATPTLKDLGWASQRNDSSGVTLWSFVR